MSFILGKCQCGCKAEINIQSSHRRILQRYAHGHNAIGENNGHYKGGRFVDKHGYLMIYKPNHPYTHQNGYVRGHRLVMEEYLGRYLSREEIVHHINGDKLDNRIENLLLTTKAGHLNIHRASYRK